MNIIITIVPNTEIVNADITVNGKDADITKHDDKSVLIVPVINEFKADFTKDGIDLKVVVTDTDIEKVTFYEKTIDENGDEVFKALIQKAPESGDKVSVVASYQKLIGFGNKITLKVVVKDTYGNETDEIIEATCNLITSNKDFKDFVDNYNDLYRDAEIKLGIDIDLTDDDFANIKYKSNSLMGTPIRPFIGVFDGCGHTIKGLTKPLFNKVGQKPNVIDGENEIIIAEVKNLGIIDSTIDGKGAIAQNALYANIDNCYSTATISSRDYAGGLIGEANEQVIISNCYTSGNITGNVIGGILGKSTVESLEIKNCYSIANLNATGDNPIVGGLVGELKVGAEDFELGLTYGKLTNSYYLKGTNTYDAIGKLYYGVGTNLTEEQIAEIEAIVENMNTNAIVADEATLKGLVNTLGTAYKADFDGANAVNNGYPILVWQQKSAVQSNTSSITSVVTNEEISSELELPLKNNYTVVYDYGTRVDPVTGEESVMHYGMDISTSANDIVYAIANGTVTYVAAETEPGVGYGNCIEIRHEINGKIFYSFYAHLKELPTLEVGDSVKKGDEIGIEGESGKTTGIHLHFEIRLVSQDYSSAVDPKTYLNF